MNKTYKVLKWLGVALGVIMFICVCLVGLWMYAIATIPNSETVTVGEIGNVTNKTATFSIKSDENITLQWACRDTNQSRDIHVSCDLINEAKKPISIIVTSSARDEETTTIEPGAKVKFFEGSLTNLISDNKVHFQRASDSTLKKLKLGMHFDEDFKMEPPIEVQLYIYRPPL